MTSVQDYQVGRTCLSINLETGRFADGRERKKADGKKGLTAAQCMETIRQLSNIQGYYSSLYVGLEQLRQNNPEDFDTIMKAFESEQFPDTIELVLYLEA